MWIPFGSSAIILFNNYIYRADCINVTNLIENTHFGHGPKLRVPHLFHINVIVPLKVI
jgi:hypothetical protein